MQQRGIHHADLLWILQYGFITERAGVHIYTLLVKHVPYAQVPPEQAERLAVLLDADRHVGSPDRHEPCRERRIGQRSRKAMRHIVPERLELLPAALAP